MTYRCIIAGLILCLFPAVGRTADTRMLDIRPVYRGPAERTFFYADGADEKAMIALRYRLAAYGAHKIVYFVPDVIACDLPTAVDAREVIGQAPIQFTAHSLPTPRGGAPSSAGFPIFSLNWVRQLYAERDRHHPAIDNANALEPRPAEQSLPRAPLQRLNGAFVDRGAKFNTDLMVGNVLAQIVTPESNELPGNTETWTDSRISSVISSASLAFIYYQDAYRNAPLDFTIRRRDKVPTDFEPIKETRENRGLWINDVMASLGFVDPGGDHMQAVTDFNNDARAQFENDWVFTVFVVNAENDADKRFSGSSGNSFPNRGGPYFAMPNPVANVRGNGIGNFGQSFKHDVGHTFWAVEETPGASSNCQTFSGYLAYQNGNKQTGVTPFGAKEGCFGTPDNCVMNYPDAMNLNPSEPCRYTAGQHGVSDDNLNGVPDALDTFPSLVFETTGIDTVLERTYPLRFRAESRGINNKNPEQPIDERTNFAVPVRMVARSENGVPAQVLPPIDDEYDELIEEFEFEVTALPSGLSQLTFVTRNTVGRTGPEFTKRLFFLGLTYLQLDVDPTNNGNKVSWVMLGESFDASINLHRVTLGEGGPVDEIIAMDLSPVKVVDPFSTYEFFDGDVTPTVTYQYYIEGTFDIVYQGQLQNFVSTSDVLEMTAVIPFSKERVLSVSAPNPFTDRILTTVFVPELEAVNAGSTNQGLSQSRVIVSVYDVAGRLVKTVFDDIIVAQTFTVEWDGTNDTGSRASTGIYFMKANVGPFEAVNKIVLVR